ncbi:MAG: response regulator [Planctomycetes bacterium]|nr:response regulator [Planctomycetota bacterium]
MTMKILLMEDELAIRVAMKRALKRAGHNVFAAANLSEARELALKSQPQVLVSDLKLPDGSGLQLAEELMIPFIIMSGYAVFEDAVAALRLGCVDFFTKPVSVDSIIHRIEGLEAGHHNGELAACIEVENGVRMMQAHAHDFEVQDLHITTCKWSDPKQARIVYDDDREIFADCNDKHLFAELLQATNAGRLVINQRPGCCSMWLDTAVDWQQSQEQEERLQVIQHLSDLCIQRHSGVFVERYHGAA